MSQLLQVQEDFLACLLADDAPLPEGWDARREARLAIYRNAYRSRLIDVLRATFERTARLVGDEAFAQAAAHHLIMRPPTSWTIDLAGKQFAETCAELFTKDPDVGELAWLEWAMNCAFTAADAAPMTLASFAATTAHFDAGQWDSLGLTLMPGTALRQVTFDVATLWRGLADPDRASEPTPLDDPHWLLVWRDDELPMFSLVNSTEGRALSDVLRGTPFGQAFADALINPAADSAAELAGDMLRRWIEIGLIEAIRSSAWLAT